LNLVTGATGIIGSHVVLALLQDNQPVIACRQRGSDLAKVEKLFSYYTPHHKTLFAKIHWVEVDVLDVFSLEEALEGITNVYHCAGFVSFDPRQRKKLFEINEKGTRNVVDACLYKKIKALCHVSSVATINNSDYSQALNEEIFWKKSGRESDYAISKYNAEREVWRGIEEGLNAVIVNPGIVLSPGFWTQSSSRLFESCFKGNRFYTNGLAGYVSVGDVARIMIALVSQKRFGQRYILVENNYTYRNILNHIHTHLNKPAPYIQAGGIMLNLASFLERISVFFSGKEPMISKPVITAALNKQVFSNQKIKDALGKEFEPTHKIIEQICGYYRLEKIKTQASV
jgi:dihydroflavonol-4-reductase